MGEKMKAAFLYEPGKIDFEELEVPKPGPGEVLVKVAACGLCGSDIHYYEHGKIGSFVVEAPLILGHECGGTVVELGEGVRNVKVGDRVAIEPGVPCRTCRWCKSGRYNLCPDVRFLATPPIHGAFVEYIVHAADFVFPIPDRMTFEQAAMCEPLSVGIFAARRGKVTAGDFVAVLGTGPIGLMTIQAAKAFGASTVVATDVDNGRLALAEKLGADYTVNAAERDVKEALAETGTEPDVVIETAGTKATTAGTVELVRRGGRCVWVGLAPEGVFEIPVIEAVAREVDIYGVFRYANTYPTAVNMIAAGQVDVASCITSRFVLGEVDKAIELGASHAPDQVKIMVTYD